MREDRVRHEPVVALDGVLREQQVVLDHPHLVVGHVLELPLAADVAEGEHPADGGLLEGVDNQAAVLVAGQPGGGHVEKVGVDDPPDREEHRVGLDPGRFATLGRRRERPPASVVPGLGDGRAQPDVVAGLGDLRCRRGRSTRPVAGAGVRRGGPR